MKISHIIEEIKTQLEIPMTKWVDAQCERIEALIQYKKTDEYRNIKSGGPNSKTISKSVNQYWHLIGIGYTKKELGLTGYSKSGIKEFFKKEAAHKMLRVDVAVNKKLKDLDIISIKQIRIRTGLDGFIEGDWIVNTKDNKQYKFRFETILAGGYNIQCLHIRTKYQLKEIKV